IERHGAGEAVVRALGVVEMTPGVEDMLSLLQALERWPLQSLGLERAMEALLLAQRLGMAWPGMAHAHAALDQPYTQHGEVVAAAVAPRRAVVGGDAPGQAVAPEGRDQPCLDS